MWALQAASVIPRPASRDTVSQSLGRRTSRDRQNGHADHGYITIDGDPSDHRAVIATLTAEGWRFCADSEAVG